MAINSSTLKFLPAIFQTDTNEKFLNATLDQLTTDADLRRVNGYIGRKFAPTYKTTDNYIAEPTTARQNYQLEPSVVVQNKQDGTVSLFSTYIDLIQQINTLGGNTTDHSRLFANESYTFSGLFDFDKFGNYNNYYWLPDGPTTVDVYAGKVDTEETFTVTRNLAAGGYNFSGKGLGANPVLTLARGGTYKFNLGQQGNRFWIQTEPGVSGTMATQSSVNTRDVYGVSSNGASVGQIVFTVPRSTAQDYYSKMTQAASVDVATKFSYNQIQHQMLSVLLANHPDVFDGVVTNINKKSLIFINTDIDDVFWETPGIFDKTGEPYDSTVYDPGDIVIDSHRRGSWVIDLQPSDNDDYLIVLTPDQDVLPNQRVYVASGLTNANQSYWLERTKFYSLVPENTAAKNRLFYQDGSDPNLFGVIEIVEADGYSIDVNNNIIGQKAYTSPNGVIFTNGLKVQFDNTVTDPAYIDNEYYVEGVGTSIVLVKASDLVTPEAYAVNGINTPDYITINRDSIDHNAWSRSNRWFHIDVIQAAAAYNNTVASPDQAYRAQRPIIEFEGHLQLFNAGCVAKVPVDLLVNGNTITDAMNQVEGYPTMGASSVTINGVTFADGQRVIFADDPDLGIRNSIFLVNVIDTTGGITTDRKLHLTLVDDHEVLEGNCINVTAGANAGLNYWYDGTSWNKGQLKIAVNQSPLFDIVDASGTSLGDTGTYPISSFSGTAIFSYKTGAGANDKVLGFPLSYRNFNSIGDIQFINNFDTESVTYASGTSTVSVPVNYNFIKQNVTISEYKNRNIWIKNNEQTKQYQIFSYAYNGSTNYFPVDIAPEAETITPYTKVFLNNQLLKSSNYSYTLVGSRPTVRVDHQLLNNNDKIDILIYSKTVSKTGYYEIPNSLDYNSKNSNFSSLTLGQIRNHITKIKENTKLAVEVGSTFSGLRDINYKSNGGNIVQQSAPAMYSNIFLTDKNLNFAQSIDYAAKEYTRFKNKFLELATKLDTVDPTDVAASVDAILKNINAIKNKTFPWYYSDMVPYGDNANIINYSIINPLTKQYEITQVFVDIELSNLAVLVYLNGVQLVNGVDFIFPQDRSAIIIDDSITLTAGDSLKIVEYYNTDGNFIPETPSKLGLYPKFAPQRFVDYSYITPVEVIQGHDGSITPVFNDVRDSLLLELEKRIYNNIKINYETHIFDLYDHLPGKFRNNDYSLAEFNQILSNKFLRWVGDNKVDYSTNNYFESGNAWTWNYKKFKDRVDGSNLPGTWRAIFNYFFDTYRPNTHPWEMLGFGQKPVWWEDRYGPAPYTGSNTLLWEDLEAGYIHEGTKAGIDQRFARPGLSRVIPVDDYGSLLSPEKWATASFDSLKANSSYSVGDQGPVEFAWRVSSYFPYAIQYALALSKPGYYFGSLINVDRYYRNTTIDQLVNKETHQRITPLTVVINGDSTSGTTTRSAGYLNWIRDYVLSIGIDPTVLLQTYLNSVNIQLGYKVGGYTDKNFIEVLAEQGSPTNTSNSIIIPTENYSVQLNASTPIRKAVYSAVVVERSSNGFTVNGYNQNSPYFTIIPSLANNNFYIVEALKRRGIIYKDYQPVKLTVPYGFEFNTEQEVVDFLISYGRYLTAQGFKFETQDDNLGETRNWALSAKEFLNWAQQGWRPGSIIVLSPVYNELVNIQPDGVIGTIDNTPNGTKVLDQNSNFIKNTQFTESRIGNKFVLTSLSEQTICLADFTVIQYEHAILFDNVTVFNDILYVPELGNRQYRLKLIGSKTGSWSGTLSPPGFVYNNTQVDPWQPGVDYLLGSIVQYKNLYYTALDNITASTEFVQNKQWRQINHSNIKTGLLPNFSYNATRLEQVYDVDNLPGDMTFEGYGTSLIGFRKRGYLSNFGLDETSQVKFFQGFIKEKGTLNAITGLTNAKVNEWASGIDIYEEWALRVGEYGSLNSDQVVELVLDETVVTANPATIELLNNGDIETLSSVIKFRPTDLYKAPANFQKNIFFNRTELADTVSDIQTAGYASLTDVDDTLFSFTTYGNLDTVLSKIGPGYHIWVAKDYTNNWNVYRITETQINVTSLVYNIDNLMTVNFSADPGLTAGDVFAIKAFDSRLDGFYQVYAVNGTTSVQVAITNTTTIATSTGVDNSRTSTIKELKTINGYGVYYKLQSVRLNSLIEANGIIPLNGWEAGDKLWVDHTTVENDWGVFEKVDAWEPIPKIVTDEAASANANFGTTITSSRLANNFFVGSPNYSNSNGSTGIVKTFSRVGTKVTQTSKFDPRSSSVGRYGQAIMASDYVVAVGAPTSNTNKGYVYVHNLSTGTLQILTSNVAATGDFFGNAVAIGDNNDWLYVGAPGVNSVYVYNLQDNITTKSNTITYSTTLVANVTSGSATITVSSPSTIDTNRIFNGTTVTGPNLPSGTSVLSVDGNSILLSQPASATSSDDTIVVTSNNCRLSYTPASKYALEISDQYTNYIADVDFTLSGDTITFVNPPVDATKVSILQANYYTPTGRVVIPADVVAGDRFGESVETTDDGKTLFVGAPGQSSNAGAVYVYKLFEENYNSNLDNLYISDKAFGTYTKVYVDDVPQEPGLYTITSGTRLSFVAPLTLGHVVTIVSDQWVLVQKITEPTQTAGNKFGSLITIDHIMGSAFYVSAPNTMQYSGEAGAVYRYSDTAKITGSVVATNYPDYVKRAVINGTTFNSNIGIYINNYYVDLSSAVETTNQYDTASPPNLVTPAGYAYPDVCVSLINLARIPSVTASVTPDGFFAINSSRKNNNNKLSIRPNASNLLDTVGLSVYNLDQVIKHPAGSVGIGFASAIKYSPDTETLLISSTQDSIYYVSEIDTGKTTFDRRSTRPVDKVNSTGSVYMYEMLYDINTGTTNTGTMSYVQHIKSDSLKLNDQFGSSVNINKDLLLVGSPGNDSVATNAGAVFVYTNISQQKNWTQIHNREARVDLNNINRLFIYNKLTNLIETSLDYIDPVKGKILGIAEQELDFKTALDPAVYNSGTKAGVAFNNGYQWNERYVGKIWWKLDNVRFIDYEQGDLIYRTNNWGKLFPGSSVQVCEWVESKYPPAQYKANGGDGTPLYNNAYCMITTVVNGIITPVYYYWVTNKQSAAAGKNFSVSELADIIENPQLQGIPYAFLMKDNAIGLVNIQNYLNNANSVLHIDYQQIVSQNSVHAEYELVNENQPNIQIPTRIVDKIIDSLSGIDNIGQVVPDPTLKASESIGLGIRPLQTLVLDRPVAVENVIKYVNGVLIQYPIVYQYSLLGLEKVDPIPAATEYDKTVSSIEDIGYIDARADIVDPLPVGYRVLVISDSNNSGLWTIYKLNSNRTFGISRIQYYNTALYWDRVDWYASDYDPTGRINYTVTTYKEVAALTPIAGDIIKVNYDDSGQFAIYRVDTDLNLIKVGIQNGTIQFKSTLYDLPSGQMGWDEDRFDSVRFDQTPSIEIRNILIALRDDIFIDSLGAEFNKLFFVIVNYILQEQNSVDWIFKTSFISIFHKLRELSQPPSFVLDNQSYYLDYINEVKPYRTIVREYVVNYTGSDTVDSNITDFDLPSIYNKTAGKYRTPSGETANDNTLLNITPEYQYWKKYHSYLVDSVVVGNAGQGYLIEPAVIIVGGGGTGAAATAAIWGNGTIKSITVTNSGSGYTSVPTVKINGTGSGAIASARLVNHTTRQFDSVLKFDRLSYDSNVEIWNSSNSYIAGTTVAYKGQAYRPTANVSASDNFDYGIFKLLTGSEAGNANDRIITYIASPDAPRLDLTTTLGQEIYNALDNNFWLTQYIGGIDYPGVSVQGLKFDANILDQQKLDTVIQSRYIDTGLGTRPEDINIDGGAYIDYYSSHAPEELIPGAIQDSIDITVYTKEVYSGNNTVKSNGVKFVYKEFYDINSDHTYYRVDGTTIVFLVADIDTTSNAITVNDSSVLSVPNLERAQPGRINIDGEVITYWENDTATNTLRNIRRAVGGTANQLHSQGSIVYDIGVSEIISGLSPRTALISSNSSYSSSSSINYWRANTASSVFTVVDNPTYKLTLLGNITANIGDYITQQYSNANVTVRGNTNSSRSVAVVFNSGTFTTANANCVLYINGTITTVAPNNVAILGNVGSDGRVMITATTGNVEIRQDSLGWLDVNSLSGGFQFSNVALPARSFIGQGATTFTPDLSNYYANEDNETVLNNIMMSEDLQLIIKE